MLAWDPVELIDCLGVAPVEEEDGISHSFEVSKDGMRLLVSVFPYDGDVRISVFRESVVAPVIEVRIVDCDAVRRIHDKRGDYVEFGAGRLFGGRYDRDSVIPYGVRVRVAPAIRVEIFRVST